MARVKGILEDLHGRLADNLTYTPIFVRLSILIV